jgi:hypothetical protein
MSSGPLCFVLMPFGKKPDSNGNIIDFDAVHATVIQPAIRGAGMTPIRADEEMTGGIIHKPMFERLVICEYAVADLTTANANVFYELGVRHAVRPWSTVLLFAEGGRLPFDVTPLRALPYKIDSSGKPADAAGMQAVLTERLKAARSADKDSPVFQLLDWIQPTEVAHAKTDVFRERVEYAAKKKDEIAKARKQGVDALSALDESLGTIRDVESAVVIDLFLSYRAVKAWDRMVALVDRMPRPLRETVLVQEQLGLALNRLGRGEEAERVLCDLIDRRGPSSETYGLLGRVYKDRWEAARAGGTIADKARAKAMLAKAIDAYLRGFEADWRDAYPGVNAVTLMELGDPPDPRASKLVPVVAYAVERRIEGGKPDYWDYATLLELAILGRNRAAAEDALGKALANVREVWEPETTVRNLRLIRETRERRGDALEWAAEFEEALQSAASTR